MKLVNFYATDGIRAGLVRPEGVEDLASSGTWQGPAPVAQEDVKQLAKRVQQSASALDRPYHVNPNSPYYMTAISNNIRPFQRFHS